MRDGGDGAFGWIRAIFPPVSREDPKPGRWLLPLVVAGLIGFTYVFVNALPEAEVADASPTSTTEAATTTTTAPRRTTTTLDPDVQTFVDLTTNLESNVTDLADLAQQINDDWDARDAEFSATREALEDLETQTVTLADDTANEDVPPALSDWDDVTAGLGDMRTAAANMIDGLVNAEGSEPRLNALEDYKAAVDAIKAALATVRDAVLNPAG